MPQGLEEEEHNPSDSQAGHRIQGEAGQIQVGSGEDSVVVEPLPAAEGALRAPRGHPSGVPRSRMRAHLLALCSAVMLGVLRELFQIESAGDLDFGIYRIMGQKRSEVEAFIDERLPEIVDEALRSGAVSRQAGRAEELRQKA